jgi:PAS domain S-box-containing protein
MLWETAPDAVVLMDSQGKVHFANPAVRDVFGYGPDELIGKPITLIQPDRGTSISPMVRRAAETVGRRKDGVEIPIEVSFSEMSLNGERRFVGFIRDITMRKRAEREIRESQEQFRVAREIQQRLFPKSAPVLEAFDIAGATYPAEATGGDYFDYLPMLNDRWGIIVADVTGHGVGPALLMAETRAYLRILAGRREDVGEILTRANSVLAEDVGSERFVTLFLARLDPRDRALVYASAGHTTAYIMDRAGNVRQTLPRTGVPLGIHPQTRKRHITPHPKSSLSRATCSSRLRMASRKRWGWMILFSGSIVCSILCAPTRPNQPSKSFMPFTTLRGNSRTTPLKRTTLRPSSSKSCSFWSLPS